MRKLKYYRQCYIVLLHITSCYHMHNYATSVKITTLLQCVTACYSVTCIDASYIVITSFYCVLGVGVQKWTFEL